MALTKIKGPVPLLLAVFAAVTALGITAAPIKRADLSANPVWALHLDCDALRQTYLGKYLLYHLSKPEMNSNRLAFQSIFNIDLRTQLHGLTVYSDGPTTRDGVFLVYADFNPDSVIALAKGAKALQITTNNQHVIYSWIDKNGNPNDPNGLRSYGTIERGRMISGKDKERVNAALAVIDGTAPNLSAGKALPDLAAAGDATFFQASARNLDFLGADPNAALVKMSKRARFRAAEVNEQINAVLTLEVDDEAKARQMSVVAQGLIALLSLQKDNPKAAGLAGGMSVKQNGGTMTVTLSVPSADLIAAIKAYQAEKEKPPAQTK